MKCITLSIVLSLLFMAQLNCQTNKEKNPADCIKGRKLTIHKEEKIISNKNFSILILAGDNPIYSNISNDSLYYGCLNFITDSLITVIFKEGKKEYKISGVYKNIFDMPQDAEFNFKIDSLPFNTKKFGYSEAILSKASKEIFFLIVNPNEYGIGHRYTGFH